MAISTALKMMATDMGGSETGDSESLTTPEILPHKITIAVDGPAASGKGTIARKLAEMLGFAYLDTGSLYRRVGLAVLRSGGNPGDDDAAVAAAEQVTLDLSRSEMDDPALRNDSVAAAASIVAAKPAVRDALLAAQRKFAIKPPSKKPGSVLDGRDIGTIVCPDADLKIFVTADAGVRAERRHKELLARGEKSDFVAVLTDLKTRDARDSTRSVAPLKPASDAVILDTSAMNIEQAVAAALNLVRDRLSI